MKCCAMKRKYLWPEAIVWLFYYISIVLTISDCLLLFLLVFKYSVFIYYLFVTIHYSLIFDILSVMAWLSMWLYVASIVANDILLMCL